MKGVEEAKGQGHGFKHHQSNQSLGLETGALFPRLHVKETNKVGPRAPPRNKMALYEQLTIPSHRFMTTSLPLPSATRKPGSAPQYSVYDGRYLYPQSSFKYAGTNPVRPCMGQPSLGSSTSTVVDCDELQRVPGVSQVESSAPSPAPASGSTLPTYSTRQHKHALSSKKHRIGDDFTVPTYSAPQSSKWSTLRTSGLKDMKGCPTDPTCSLPHQVHTESMKRGEAGISDVEGATDSVTGKDQICTDQCRNAGLGRQGHILQIAEGCSNLQALLSGVQKLPNGTTWNNSQLLYRAHAGDIPCRDLRNSVSHERSMPGSASCTGSDESVGARCRKLRSDRESKASYQFNLKISERTGASVKQGRLSDPGPCDGLPCIPKANVSGQKYPDFQGSRSHDFESYGDSEHHTSGSDGQTSEPSLGGGSTGDESDSSMVDCVSIQRISATDVIGAIGQQEFWRTRKAILRQQRIFSVQIFELHRLVKVQQLMAMSSTAEYVVSGGCSGFVPSSPETNVCGKAKILEHDTCNDGLKSIEPFSRKAVEAECLAATDSSGKDVTESMSLESEAPTCRGSVSQVSGFSAQMASTWVYPPYVGVGVHPWIGPMCARPGALMYQYPTSFSPNGTTLLGAYGPYRSLASNSLEGSPLMCFGPPSYERWSELLSESCSKLSTMTQRHPATYYCSAAASSDPLSPWFLPQGVVPNYTERSCDSKLVNETELFPPALFSPSHSVKPGLHTAIPEHGGHPQKPGSAFRSKNSVDIGRLNLQANSSRSSRQKVGGAQNMELSLVQAEECWTRGQPENDSIDGNVSAELMSHVQASSARGQVQRSQKRARDVLPNLGAELDVRGIDTMSDPVESSPGLRHPLPLFPVLPVSSSGDKSQERSVQAASDKQRVVKIAPRAVVATPESAAGILLSIQQERRR